jgi:hypothetical protein
MSIVTIPTPTGFARATPELVSNDIIQVPPGGGVTQTLQRLGTRWALSVELPPARENGDFRAIMSALVQARRFGAAYPWPQPGITIGTPGSPVVNGAGQLGSSLVCSGFSASYSVVAGQFFSILTGGRRYLHMITAAGTATGGGALTLQIFPMLRISPAASSPISMTPLIEGNVEGNFGWTHEPHDWVPLSFRITEVA